MEKLCVKVHFEKEETGNGREEWKDWDDTALHEHIPNFGEKGLPWDEGF